MSTVKTVDATLVRDAYLAGMRKVAEELITHIETWLAEAKYMEDIDRYSFLTEGCLTLRFPISAILNTEDEMQYRWSHDLINEAVREHFTNLGFETPYSSETIVLKLTPFEKGLL